MDVAVKVMLFQNTPKPGMKKKEREQKDGNRHECDRQLVLREVAVGSSVSHPNVVATYHYEVLQASSFHATPSGLDINDQSGEEAFKLYLIQVIQAAGGRADGQACMQGGGRAGRQAGRRAGRQAGRVVALLPAS